MPGKLSSLWLLAQSMTIAGYPITPRTRDLLIPSLLRCGNNIRGNIGNIILTQTSTESRHGILSVGHLCPDRSLATSSGKVLVKGSLLKSLLGHDNILSSSVAGSAVGVEDLFSGSNISSEGGGDGNSGSDGGTGNGGLDSL